MFVKLNVESLGEIRPMLESKLPVSAQVLNMVNMKLNNRYPEEDQVDFYGYQGVPSDICNLFVIVCCKHYSIPTIAVLEPDNVTEHMWTSFCDFCDWSKVQEIEGFSSSFGSSLEKIANDKGGRLVIDYFYDMYLPVDEALNIDLKGNKLNENFQVQKLRTEHGAIVNTHWRYSNSSETRGQPMTNIIRTMGGVGVFRKAEGATTSTTSDEAESHLVSWVVGTRIGTLGALYTLEEYRRRGLGAWTLAAAAKWMANEGFVPLCQVEEYNKDASWILVQKVGFRSSRKVFYADYYPSGSEQLIKKPLNFNT